MALVLCVSALVLIPLDGLLSEAAVAWRERLGGDLRRFIETWQQFGDLSSMLFVALLVWLLDTPRRRALGRLALAAFLTFAVVQALKILIGRPRPRFHDPLTFLGPFGTYEINAEIGPRHAWEIASGISSDLWSMPSSHTAFAVVLGLFLAWLYPRLRPVTITLVVIVAFARVLLGAHYPSDVLMGAGVALFICARVYRPIMPDGPEPTSTKTTRKPRRSRRHLIAVLAALGLLAGGSTVLWHKIIRHHLFPRNFGVVVEGRIYRSGRLTDTAMRSLVRDRHLRTIIDLGAFDPDSPREAHTRELARQLGVRRIRLNLIGDGTGDPNDYVTALRIMTDPDAQPVLVQCGAGSERTGVAVMLYRNLFEGVPIQKAYEETFRYKHDRDDWTMLAYVADWKDAIARALQTGKPIPYPPPESESPPNGDQDPSPSESDGTPSG